MVESKRGKLNTWRGDMHTHRFLSLFFGICLLSGPVIVIIVIVIAVDVDVDVVCD